MSAVVQVGKMTDGSPDVRVVLDIVDAEGKPAKLHLAITGGARLAKCIAEDLDECVAWAEVRA